MAEDEYISFRKEGICLYNLGKYEEAIEYFNKALEIEPNDYLSLTIKGYSLDFLKRHLEAIDCYDRALNIKPNDYEPLASKGASLSGLDRNKEAIECLDRVLTNEPNNFYALLFKGISLNRLKREEEAIEYYDRALTIKPKDTKVLKNKGVSLSNIGREEEAIGYFDQVLAIFPDDFDTLTNKGVTLSKIGRDEEAIENFDRVLKIKPDYYDALRDKGASLYKLERKKESIEYLDRALAINRNDFEVLRTKGLCLLSMDHPAEAIIYFDLALTIKSDDYISLNYKGIAYRIIGRIEESIELHDEALKIKPDDDSSLLGKALSLEAYGDIKKAKEIYDFLGSRIDKIKDPNARAIVDFKKHIFNEIKEDIKRDVLNEIVNKIQYQQNNFFSDIDRIESKFKTFIDSNRSIPNDFTSFLSVLRKWNSYTPILPSEDGDNKGGGYFLYHRGKGIVIDPGFNFIENFYQEGFKAADIDAILITHAHNDHTVDLESILTLVYKHNDAIEDAFKNAIEDVVRKEMEGKNEYEIQQEIGSRLKSKQKQIDLLINVGTFMKYSGWLNLRDSSEIKKVTVLMPDTEYKLPEYGMTIYTTNAKHDEIISKQYAIGFILEIDERTKVGSAEENIKIGFTGDTGWDWDQGETMVVPFKEKDKKPQLVVAHLGSIKRNEFEYIKKTTITDKNKCFYSNHLGLLGMTKFLEETKPYLTVISEFGEELREKRKLIVKSIGEVLNLCCLPGDIGLHIRLCDLNVHCFIKEDFVDFKSIEVLQEGSVLYYYGKESNNQRFNDALNIKRSTINTPLSERTKSYVSVSK